MIRRCSLSRPTRLVVPILALVLILISAVEPAEARKKKSSNPPGTLDGGKLVMSWFGDGDIRFAKHDEIDYIYVKEGFDLSSAKVHFEAWPDPEFLGEGASERDAKDRRLARQMNSEMARLFQEEWGRVLGGNMSLEEGNVLAEGRIVDCSTGSTAAKMLVGFGAGSGFTTIDIKMTDKKTGELLLGLHHRVVSGTSWSTTDSKFANWVEEAAEEMHDAGGAAALYAKSKPAKK